MIPPLNAGGLLPPFVGTDPADWTGVSPYAAEPIELVQRFGTNPERSQLLRGLFAWRAALGAAGITGLQWINGSFCEDVEKTAGHPPVDIDVITFVLRPQPLLDPAQWIPFVTANPQLFDAAQVKHLHGCDGYMVDVMAGPGGMLAQTTYWFGLFSHKRVTLEWKGMLSLELPADDGAALALLNAPVVNP